MKILICGDRHWRDEKKIAKVLFKLRKKVKLVIHGGARGADQLAGKYAMLLGIPTAVYEANWTKHGRAAGPIRNQSMLKFGKPDMVIAFHKNLNKSKGTKNMVGLAKKAKVKVRIVK